MDLILPGQKLSLSFTKNEHLVEIFCSIEKVDNDRIIIELPQYFMRYIEFLEVGSVLTAKAFSKFGTINFNTIVISSPLEEEFSIELDYNAIELTPNDEIPVIKSMEDLNIEKNDTIYKMKTFEISTDYLKFYGDKRFQEGESFNCKLILAKNYGIISFNATITEIDPVYDNEYKVSYSQMTEHDRQLLLYYMYIYSNNIDQEII